MHVRSEFTKRPIPRTGGPTGWAELLPTRDGYVTLSPWMRDALRAAPVAFGVEPAPDELTEGEGMVAAKEPSLAYYKPILAERTSAEVFHGLAELSVNLAWVRSAGDLLDDPHLAELGFSRELETAELGTLRTTGPPARLSQAEHAAELVAAQGGEHDGFERRQRPAQASGPLDGLRVVDFTHAWLGPYATALLADLGAEVIKVEGPRRPDLWRHETRWSMPIAAPDAHLLNIRANFHMANRNKRNVSLALDTDEGRALALELIARADLVLENFRPRVLEESAPHTCRDACGQPAGHAGQLLGFRLGRPLLQLPRQRRQHGGQRRLGHAARLPRGSAAAARHDAGRPNLRRADGRARPRRALAAGQ